MNPSHFVCSQSLSTLDTIEEFLSKQKVPRPDLDENWAKGRSYLREYCYHIYVSDVWTK